MEDTVYDIYTRKMTERNSFDAFNYEVQTSSSENDDEEGSIESEDSANGEFDEGDEKEVEATVMEKSEGSNKNKNIMTTKAISETRRRNRENGLCRCHRQ